MTSENRDKAIVEGYLAGEHEAVKQINDCIDAAYRNWQNRFGYLKDDIISDTRLKLLISLRRGDYTYKSSIGTYVSGILRHTCLDYYRGQKRFENVDLDDIPLSDPNPTAQDLSDRRERAFMYFRVLRMVSDECRQLWRMQLKEGMRARAIGERLGKSETNVRGLLMRCRQKAREIREKLSNNGKRF